MKPRFVPLIFAAVFLLPLLVTGDKPIDQKTVNVKSQAPIVEQSQNIIEKEPINSEPVKSPSRSGEEINWQVISSGGNKGTSTNYIVNGTLSQTATDEGSSTNFIIHHGYWQEFAATGPCDCEPGETDGLLLINILDIVYLINYKYKEGPAPIPYALCSGDTNRDCVINILDIVLLINFKYKEGPAPYTCEEWMSECGPLQK